MAWSQYEEGGKLRGRHVHTVQRRMALRRGPDETAGGVRTVSQPDRAD
jgi:hypothetical protein